MSGSEFDIIRRYFTDTQSQRPDVSLGVGDDAAVLLPPPGQSLVVTVDTLVNGVHFPVDTHPNAIGYKSLAVNLSDLAAMGAEPAWFTLAITLPEPDEEWLTQFSQGMFLLAGAHNLQLVGGDTTRGPLSITIQVMGFVPEGKALTRGGARVGDGIYVTGTLGDAGVGLLVKQNRLNMSAAAANYFLGKLERPAPQVAAGLVLRELASAALDISDGLPADLNHLLTASHVGADINIHALPMSSALKNLSTDSDWQKVISAGDDYELCFTACQANEGEIHQRLNALDCQCTKIGTISEQEGLRWHDETGREITFPVSGYDHFKKQTE